MKSYKSFYEANRKGISPATIAKYKDKQRSKQDLAKKSRQHGAMRDQGYRWDKERMQWVHEDKRGRKSYMDTNPDLEETIWDILIKFQHHNEKRGITWWRFKNSEVVDELDKHPVYGISGTNPWHADDKSKEKVISRIRNEWGIVDPHRKQMSSKGTKQDHTTGHTQSPLLNPEQ